MVIISANIPTEKSWVEILVCQAVVNVSSESFSLLFKIMEMKNMTGQNRKSRQSYIKTRTNGQTRKFKPNF